MAKVLDNDDMVDYVINYIDKNGEPCTWIGSEKGLSTAEEGYEIKMIIKLIPDEC